MYRTGLNNALRDSGGARIYGNPDDHREYTVSMSSSHEQIQR